MTRRWQVVTGAILAIGLWATPALAQERQWGVRGGISTGPEQFFVGGHYETRPLIERLTFRPNIEIGFDDESVLAAFNFEFVWTMPIERKPMAVYFGGGPAVNVYNYDNTDDNVGPGVNFVGGLKLNQGLFFEVKFGVIDSPEFKLTVGYAFR